MCLVDLADGPQLIRSTSPRVAPSGHCMQFRGIRILGIAISWGKSAAYDVAQKQNLGHALLVERGVECCPSIPQTNHNEVDKLVQLRQADADSHRRDLRPGILSLWLRSGSLWRAHH
jgi:hypothetical protein